MKFVNFIDAGGDLYDLRAYNSEITRKSLLNRYLLTWMTNIFYPILLVVSLRKKQYLYSLLVFGGSMLIFTIAAGKIDFFMPFIIVGFYFILEKNIHFIRKYFFSILVGIIALLGIILFVFMDTDVGFQLSAIFFMRTLGIAGYLFVHYILFFLSHPYTNFAHINIINSFTGWYPYHNRDLGKVVFYDSMNGNANFWIMDGVAGQGIFGVIIVSIILCFLLVFMNRLKTIYDERILYLLFLPVIMTLLNVSLFTTVLTGGGLILVIILYTVNIDSFKKR